MPYINVVQNYSAANRFEYNHKAIFAQVRKAMKHTGDKRDRALKDILRKNYLKDIKVYEPMKMNLPYVNRIYAMEASQRYRDAWLNTINRMAEPQQFFEQYIHIINAMAADIDKSYKPKFMLGLEREEAKELVNAQINVVSKKDDRLSYFENYNNIYHKHGIVRTRYQRDNRLIGYEYATVKENLKNDIKLSFLYKEHVKEKLESKTAFWKFFHRKEVKAMKEYIRAAEVSLSELKFTEQDGEDVKSEFAQSYYSTDERNAALNTIERRFNVEENRVQTEYTFGKEAAVNASYNIKQAIDPQMIPEGKRLVDKNLLKVGFVPKLKTLERDLKELQNVQDYLDSGRQINGGASVKLNDGTVLDTVMAETLKIAVQNNMEKLQAIKELPEEERRAHIASQLKGTYGFYTAEEEKDIQETIAKQTDPTTKANYESFMKSELEGRLSGSWSKMNQRAIEEIAALNAENGIEELGYTAPNLFLPAENPVRENINMDHLNENLNKGDVAPRIDGKELIAKNDMIV